MMRSLIFITIAITALPLFAQPVTQEELEDCLLLSGDEAILQCFEQLVYRNQKPIDPTPVVTKPAIIPSVLPSPSTLPTSPTIPAHQDPQYADTSAKTNFGQEQLPASQSESKQPPGSILVTVNEVSKDRRNYLYFHLDNGHVWRQTEALYLPYPRDTSFEVEINRGLMGGYRLRVEGKGRMVRIRRVQ